MTQLNVNILKDEKEKYKKAATYSIGGRFWTILFNKNIVNVHNLLKNVSLHQN